MNQKAFIAEFIGTFALIFLGAGSIAVDYMTDGRSGLLGIALAHGLTIAVMVAATIAVSGGHINPAVTIALFVVKKIDSVNTIGYIIAQCLGGILGAFFLALCFPFDVLMNTGFGTPALAEGVTFSTGLLIEVVLTFFLMFVIYGVAVDKRGPQAAGLFIGLTVTLNILVGGPMTGAAMNPARYLGPAVLSGNLNQIWLYWLGPIMGAVLAAVCYKNYLEEV